MIVSREIRIPGDKSLSHRALILSALASGRSRVRSILCAHDVESTAAVLRRLGVAIPPLADEIEIDGLGLRGLRQPAAELDCGNSGTTTRLMSGVVAGHPFAARFVGDASMSRRPMRRVARPLTAMGASFDFERGDGLPMTVHGGDLRSIEWRSDVPSAQVKSAVLLAALVAGVPVTYIEPILSRNHTENMLAALGAAIETAGPKVWLNPSRPLTPLDLRVPADPSSAAYFAALGVARPDREIVLPNVCLNGTRMGFFYALHRMGAELLYEDEREVGGERIGTIVARPAVLRAIETGGSAVPTMIDEIPLLACLATRAEGETVIHGAEELRVKESDRIAAVAANLVALGVRMTEQKDGLRITGSPAPLRGRVHAFGDHRIAMAFGILGALPGNRIEIDDPSCVDISYPGFWTDLRQATT
jgi:3-phosphoshikimate 1-carboxyvinyltransferase